jgi:DNA-binding beta-propeller fold protein YncE
MARFRSILARRMLAASALSLLLAQPALSSNSDQARGQGDIVVANRAGGTISVIDVASDRVRATLSLPAGPAQPEPMYVVAARSPGRIFVGDRANQRVAVFRSRDLGFEGSVAAGRGIFHMWSDARDRQLWVVNDGEGSVTVIDPDRLTVRATVPMPADLIGAGAIPHDVVLDERGRSAYVSFFNVPGALDMVVKFDAQTFEEQARQGVGKSPHLSFNDRTHELFVPSQGANQLQVLDAETLALQATRAIPSAHGAVTSRNGRLFCTTNFTGLGVSALFCLGTRDLDVRGPVDAPFTGPHNVELTPDTSKLYLTHSGANSTVSVYDVPRGGTPKLRTSISVGQNPFGLAFVPASGN